MQLFAYVSIILFGQNFAIQKQTNLVNEYVDDMYQFHECDIEYYILI